MLTFCYYNYINKSQTWSWVTYFWLMQKCFPFLLLQGSGYWVCQYLSGVKEQLVEAGVTKHLYALSNSESIEFTQNFNSLKTLKLCKVHGAGESPGSNPLCTSSPLWKWKKLNSIFFSQQLCKINQCSMFISRSVRKATYMLPKSHLFEML